jgi:hypothetical protein
VPGFTPFLQEAGHLHEMNTHRAAEGQRFFPFDQQGTGRIPGSISCDHDAESFGVVTYSTSAPVASHPHDAFGSALL